MALIITKSYILTGGTTPENYDVTYWRVVNSHIDVDSKTSTVQLKGYKSKAHRNSNGAESYFKKITVRGAWVYTTQNLNDFTALELAYMSVKQSITDEGLEINWSTAVDDVGN